MKCEVVIYDIGECLVLDEKFNNRNMGIIVSRGKEEIDEAPQSYSEAENGNWGLDSSRSDFHPLPFLIERLSTSHTAWRSVQLVGRRLLPFRIYSNIHSRV